MANSEKPVNDEEKVKQVMRLAYEMRRVAATIEEFEGKSACQTMLLFYANRIEEVLRGTSQ